MTNNALIYRRPSKWPIAAALTAAVLIHLSAVAIAFHQESPAILPAATDPTIIGVYFADAPPTPPDPDISVPPPGPVPAADFIEPEETGGVIKTQRTPASIGPSGQTRVAAVGMRRRSCLPRRGRITHTKRSGHITGSGIAVITVDPNSGLAVDAVMEQSIGNPILDNSTVSAFQTRNTPAGSHPDHFRANRRAVLKYRTSSATAFAR